MCSRRPLAVITVLAFFSMWKREKAKEKGRGKGRVVSSWWGGEWAFSCVSQGVRVDSLKLPWSLLDGSTPHF